MEATPPFLHSGLWDDSSQNRDVAGDDSIKAGSGMGSDDVSTSSNKSSPLDLVFQRLVRYPKTRLEFVLTILLGIASLILLLYLVFNLYKCMCSRNYEQWRTSWLGKRRVRRPAYYTAFRESVPLVLGGHRQEVECIVCDDQLVVSSCLGGEIRIWDLVSGECRMSIDRTQSSESASAASRQRSCSDGVSTDSEGAGTPLSAGPGSSAFSSNLSSSFTYDFTSHSASASIASGRSTEARQSGEQRSSVENLLLSCSSLSSEPPRRSLAGGHSRHKSVDSTLASIIPDLTGTIDTDFSNTASRSKTTPAPEASKQIGSDESASAGELSKPVSSPCNGYDFTHFQPFFDEHRKMHEEQMNNILRKRRMPPSATASVPSPGGAEDSSRPPEGRSARRRDGYDRKHRLSTSHGDAVGCAKAASDVGTSVFATAIWCLACHNNFVIAGCGNGSVEFWDITTGQLKYCYHRHKAGVIAVGFHGHRIVIARVNGIVDFLQWESSTRPPLSSRPVHSGDLASSSATVIEHNVQSVSLSNPPLVVLITSVRAHQYPINAMRTHGDRIVTASADHTLKVYRADDALCLYTLHGHTGGVSALCLERLGSSLVAASGSEDASVRLWDLQESGACLHKLTGHDAMVISVTMAPASGHVISVATDDRLCVWEKTGNLLHCLQLEPGYCNAVAMLTKQLAVTGGQGFIHLWDVSTGALFRAVSLSDFDSSVFIRQLHVTADNSVLVCDYGSQLRVIRFSSVLEKDD